MKPLPSSLANAGPAVRALNPGVFGAHAKPAKTSETRPAKGPARGPFKSKAEARYAEILEARKRAGEIVDWKYEPISLVIGSDGRRTARYRPDFLIEHRDGVEFVEVKGAFVREAARVRYLAAVERYPWADWTWAQWINGAWKEERKERTK